jgi:hypothetical protein
MCKFYIRTKFHMPTCNGSLVTAIKPIAKESFRAPAMLFFYILQIKQAYRNRNCIFFHRLINLRVCHVVISD